MKLHYNAYTATYMQEKVCKGVIQLCKCTV